MFKDHRRYLVIYKMKDHVSVRPITTHSGKGLHLSTDSIKEDSTCFFSFEETLQEGWVNEAVPNEVLILKWQKPTYPISSKASVRVTQTIMLDREEEFEIVAEIDESEVRKVEDFELNLKREACEADTAEPRKLSDDERSRKRAW